LPLLSTKVARYLTSLMSYKAIDIISNRVLIPIVDSSSIVDLTFTPIITSLGLYPSSKLPLLPYSLIILILRSYSLVELARKKLLY